MRCLAQAPAATTDSWQRLASLTVESCAQCLDGDRSVELSLAEPLNRFCVLCSKQGIATPLMDMQAWRKHLQLTHGVDKSALTTRLSEHAAVAHMVRPCTCTVCCLFKSLPSFIGPSAFRWLSYSRFDMAMLETAESQIAGLWGLASPTRQTPASTPERQREGAMKAKPAKYRRQDKGGGKGQQNGRKRPEPTEEEDTEPLVTVTQSEIRTIRALLIRHDQALNQLAVDRTYVLFFSTTEMATLDMLRTVTNHWRDQYEKGTCTTTLRATLLTSLWMEMEARLTKFEQDPDSIKVMKDSGFFLEAPHRWAYTMWSQQEKKALVTDQPHLSSEELRAALKTLKAAAMTDGVIHRFAPMQKLGQNMTAQTVVFTLVLTTRAKAERVHGEMAKLVNSSALSLIGLRLRGEKFS